MEVYIEYIFLENFLYDGVLLALALYASKIKIAWWKVCLSASVGALFALLFPLLQLPDFLKIFLKIAVGGLLCLLTMDGLKTKKDGGRYALNCLFFFIFSFSFGGTLLAVYGNGARVPSVLVFLGFGGLSFAAVWLVKKFYERKTLHQHIYPCRLIHGENRVDTQGFLDSGNLAQKNGLPVCFLSPDLLYELFGEEILKCGGQVCDEMAITTLAGEKNVPLYKGEIEMEGERKEVYFSPAKNMIGREYKVLLNWEKNYETH